MMDQGKPTPEELQAQLFELFEHMPDQKVQIDPDTDVGEDLTTVWLKQWLKQNRRRHNTKAYHRLLSQKAKHILSFVPGTPMFRAYLGSIVVATYFQGVDKNAPYESPMYWMLGVGKTRGIFEDDGAKELERESLRAHREFFPVYLAGDSDEVGKYINSHPVPPIKWYLCPKLHEWERQFKEIYFEDP